MNFQMYKLHKSHCVKGKFQFVSTFSKIIKIPRKPALFDTLKAVVDTL